MKTCSITPRQCMSAGPCWTTSRARPAWTATRWVPLLVAAGLCPAAEHALVPLLAFNGLRVSGATGADIEVLGLERGHRTVGMVRKGSKRLVAQAHQGLRGSPASEAGVVN